MDIRRAEKARDFDEILRVINDGAQAYHGKIPQDCWHNPYMSAAELRREIEASIDFFVTDDTKQLAAVMGVQDRGDVTLIRHAYVADAHQRQGLGTALLEHLQSLTIKPILIGTWAAASWAIEFYRNHGFTAVSTDDKNWLLRKYWTVPPRQIETSVVLADERWRDSLKQLKQ